MKNQTFSPETLLKDFLLKVSERIDFEDDKTSKTLFTVRFEQIDSALDFHIVDKNFRFCFYTELSGPSHLVGSMEFTFNYESSTIQTLLEYLQDRTTQAKKKDTQIWSEKLLIEISKFLTF